MVQFSYDQVDNYVPQSGEKINFLTLSDDGWQAKVRFMYGQNEPIMGYAVHNISADPKKPKYIPCLREPSQPLDVCPLCQAGKAVSAVYYMPVYVISITTNINGIMQEQPINQVKIFQRGKSFQGAIGSIVRQSAGTPLVNNVFNIVRYGKKNATETNYMVEFLTRDNTMLTDLPEAPKVYGSYVLPEMDYNKMLAYVNQPTPIQQNQQVVPRTISASTFGNNTVVGQPQSSMMVNYPPNNNQISPQQPF